MLGDKPMADLGSSGRDDVFVVPRQSLIDRLNTWYHAKGQDESSGRKGVMVISAPNGTGKTTALQAFARDKRAVYYSFAPGLLRREQSASACLLAALNGFLKCFDGRLIEDPAQVSRKTKPNPAFVDPQTLFDKFIAEPLQKLLGSPRELVPIVIIVDSPERCEPSSRAVLWDILCRRWASRVPSELAKLIVCTSVDPADIPVVGTRVLNAEITTRLSSKGSEKDEVIWAMFERQVAKQGEDPEWETEKIGRLVRICNGSLFRARYILAKGWAEKSILPESDEEIFRAEYRSWLGPLLCARKLPPVNLFNVSRSVLIPDTVSEEDIRAIQPVFALLMGSDAFIDWFCLGNKERCRKEGHAAAFALLSKRYKESSFAASHSLFHAMESGDVDLGRPFLVEFDKLYSFTLADPELLLSDAEQYCLKRPYDMAARVVKNCLLQSRKGLLKDPRQLPFQLLARITGVASDVRGDVDITNLMSACRFFRSNDFYWFKPIRASMQLPPETTLKVMRSHADTVLSVSCTALDSARPRLALTGSCDGTAKLFDLQSGKCELTLYNQGGGYCSGVSVAVVSEDCIVALTSTEDCNSRLWYIHKPRNGFYRLFKKSPSENPVDALDQPAHVLIGHSKELTGCAFLPGSWRVAATCSADGTAKIWDLPAPEEDAVPTCRQTLVGHDHPVLCIAFVPPLYQMVATGSKDQTVRMWTLSGQCLSVFSGHFSNVTCISFRNDGVVFATGGWDSFCKVWNVAEALNQQIADPASPQQQPVIEERCSLVHKDWIWGVAFLETDRDLLATGADNGIVRLWSISSSTCILAFDAHLGLGVYCIAPMGGDFIVTGGIDSTLRLFDVSRPRCTGRNTVAESWSAVDAPHRHQAEVRCAAFPAQMLRRRLCFLGSDDKSIRAFDLDTGRCVKRLPDKHTAAISELLVSSDENSLRSMDDKGVKVTWNRATFEVKASNSGFWSSLRERSSSCLHPCLGSDWNETGHLFQSEMDEGHLLVPGDLKDVFGLEEEELAASRPFIPLTFDTSLPLRCWCSPSMMERVQYAQDDVALEYRDPVIVVTETNGLVHFLHPMF